MRVIREPSIDVRPEIHYLGIRVRTPMKGMFQVADRLRKQLTNWFSAHAVEPSGPPFLRYHVIDMDGEMDIAVGIPVAASIEPDGHVAPDVLPAGRYASLVYVGHGLPANKTLLNWVHANNLKLDRWDDPAGDAFRCRYEAYLTDWKVEPRKTRWEIELAMKLSDG
jgi:effector-binding domain-containing protein